MNELTIFKSNEFGEVRTITENGEVLFCAKDVAAALGYSRERDAIQQHCRYAVKHRVPHPQSPDKTIEMVFIPEGDIYRLAAKSKLPGAERFERWIFDEVLPTIRKTGGYGETSSDVGKLIKCAEIMATCSDSNREYVLNILRRVVPWIDSSAPTYVDTASTEKERSRKDKASNRGYCIPFDYKAFNTALRRNGVSYAGFSGMIGCDVSAVGRWARGESRPGTQHRMAICKALHRRNGAFDRTPTWR